MRMLPPSLAEVNVDEVKCLSDTDHWCGDSVREQ